MSEQEINSTSIPPAEKFEVRENTTIPMLIEGITFQVLAPYAEGQVLGVNEAKALNALRVERVKVNWGKRVKERLGDGRPSASDVASLQNEFLTYDSRYTLSPGERRKSGDPIADMAWELAEKRVIAALKERKVQVDSIGKEKLDAKIAQIASDPRVIGEAKRRLDHLKEIAQGVVEEGR